MAEKRKKKKRGVLMAFVIIMIIAVLLAAVCGFFLVRRFYPLRYADIIRKYAEEYGFAPEFICAVIHTESRFNENAVSSEGASGLMQIIESTAYWVAPQAGLEGFDFEQIFDPEINIRLGCHYLSMLERQFGDMETALSAYNAGSGNVAEWLGDSRYSSDGMTLDNIPFTETLNYTKRIADSQRIYKIILRLGFLFQ